METPFLYFPVKDEIDQANLFGATSPMYTALSTERTSRNLILNASRELRSTLPVMAMRFM